jgi:F-type H+-transporting ATPase subunit b
MNVGALEFVTIIPWEIIVQLVNLLLLFLLLKHFLFKPIQNILAQRESEIQKDYDDASKASAEAQALREEYEKRMAEAKSEASQIVKDANRKAQTHGEEILLDARNQANRMLEKADAEIEQEKKKARNELKNEISGIAVDIASKVVEREINEKDHEALIQEFIKGVGEAS